MRNVVEYTIHNATGIKTATFTAATTDICTDNSHGLRNGEMVILTTNGTLPLGLSTSTVYYVIEVTTNTFKLSLTPCPYYTTGVGQPPATVDITGATTDTDTYTVHDIGRNIFVGDHRHAIITYDTDGDSDAALTVKFQASIGKSVATQGTADDCPDFSATATDTNRWDYIETIDLENGSAIDGDTGIAVATADDHRQLEANTNGLRWINAIISGWTAGEVTIGIQLYND